MYHDGSHEFLLLFVAHEYLSAHVSEMLVVVDHNVSSKSFNCEVEFVFVQVSTRTTHQKVWPSVNLNSVSVLVSFNVSKSFLKNGSVQERV